jgi:hypothetical protein
MVAAIQDLRREIQRLTLSNEEQIDEMRRFIDVLINQQGRMEQIDVKFRDLAEAYRKGGAMPEEPVNFEVERFSTEPVVRQVIARTVHEDSLEVTIDGGATIILPQLLALLFAFISSAGKERGGRDALLGWRSWLELKAYFEKQADKMRQAKNRTELDEGKELDKVRQAKNLNQLVYRLRQTLNAAGYNPKLIQSHRTKGVRLRHRPGAQTQQNPGREGDRPLTRSAGGGA